jgi:hypothetical protein
LHSCYMSCLPEPGYKLHVDIKKYECFVFRHLLRHLRFENEFVQYMEH